MFRRLFLTVIPAVLAVTCSVMQASAEDKGLLYYYALKESGAQIILVPGDDGRTEGVILIGSGREGASTVKSLRNLGISKIDFYVTSGDSLGMEEIYRSFKINHVWTTDNKYTGKHPKKSGAPMFTQYRAGELYQLGNAVVRVLSPARGKGDKAFLLTCGKTSMLISDMDIDTLLKTTGTLPKTDIITAPWNGEDVSGYMKASDAVLTVLLTDKPYDGEGKDSGYRGVTDLSEGSITFMTDGVSFSPVPEA